MTNLLYNINKGDRRSFNSLEDYCKLTNPEYFEKGKTIISVVSADDKRFVEDLAKKTA